MEHSPLYPPDHEQAHALGEQLTSIPTDYQKTLATFSVLDAVATGRGSTALGRFLAIIGLLMVCLCSVFVKNQRKLK